MIVVLKGYADAVITIYALDFLTAPYIMIFMRANGLGGTFEGPVPKNRDLLGPKKNKRTQKRPRKDP